MRVIGVLIGLENRDDRKVVGVRISPHPLWIINRAGVPAPIASRLAPQGVGIVFSVIRFGFIV